MKLEIEKALSTQEAKYHFRAPLVRVWRIPRHSLDSEATEVFSNSKIPSILIVALALTSNIHGDISKRERACFCAVSTNGQTIILKRHME